MSNSIQEIKASVGSLVDNLNSIVDYINEQESKSSPQPSIDHKTLRKVFLLGAKLGCEQTVYYIKGEMCDYEHDIYEDTNGSAYLHISGSITIDADDLNEQICVPPQGTMEDHDKQMLDLLSMDEEMVMSAIMGHLNPPAPQTNEEQQ